MLGRVRVGCKRKKIHNSRDLNEIKVDFSLSSKTQSRQSKVVTVLQDVRDPGFVRHHLCGWSFGVIGTFQAA